jgi:hypothetical protein
MDHVTHDSSRLLQIFDHCITMISHKRIKIFQFPFPMRHGSTDISIVNLSEFDDPDPFLVQRMQNFFSIRNGF